MAEPRSQDATVDGAINAAYGRFRPERPFPPADGTGLSWSAAAYAQFRILVEIGRWAWQAGRMTPARLALIVSAVAMVPAYGLATLFFLYASVAGDCFPELGGPCPTDHDRNMAALRVLIIAALVFGGWKLERWLAARDPGDRR